MKLLGERLELGPGSYVTYPHSNGFVPGGREMVYVQPREGQIELCVLQLESGKRFHLQTVESGDGVPPLFWFDVAYRAPVLAAVFHNRVWSLRLGEKADWQCVYTPSGTGRLHGLVSLRADGSCVLCGETREGAYVAVEIDLRTSKARDLFSHSWLANHFHYVPHDETWIGFSHEGPTEDIPDRCWAWHAEHVPGGKPVFDQRSEREGIRLCVGHERWCFHDLSAFVIAYAVSPAGKRGLYEVFADGRPATLRWDSDVFWHCSMDRTGRFAAIDTSGRWSENGLSEAEYIACRDRHVQADKDKIPNDSDVVLLDLERRESLHLARVRRSQHPYHPHPTISPDGQWVAWTDMDRGACVMRVCLDETAS